MAIFTSRTSGAIANAATGLLIGFTGGTVAQLQDGEGDTFLGGAGQDIISAGDGDDALIGGAGNDVLDGRGGNNTLQGGDGDDALFGGSGVDTLDGGAGNDILIDTIGPVAMSGGAGDDRFHVTSLVSGSINGGVGVDAIEISVVAANTAPIYDLRGATIVGVEELYVHSFTVAATAAQFESFDRITYFPGEKLETQIRLTLASAGTVDLADELAGRGVSFLGSSGADVITTSSGDDVVSGGAGDDILNGGLGDDFLVGGEGADELDGGEGVDFAEYTEKALSVVVKLNGSTNAVVSVGGVAEDVIRNVENVLGGRGNDVFTGDGAANFLDGNAGDDVLKGGAGADVLNGGAGIDLADYRDKTSSVVVTLNGRFSVDVTVGGVTEDAILDIENVIGGSGADRLTGDSNVNVLSGEAGNDVLKGGLGLDTLDGGAGADTADYSDKTASVVVTLNGSTNAIVTVGDVAEDVILNIENVRSGAGNDLLIGDRLANALSGGAGADTLVGDAGNDLLLGESGNDIIRGGDGDDTIDGGDGNDGLIGNAGVDTLHGGAGDDTLDDTIGGDALHGDAGDDLFIITLGNGGSVDGGANIDTILVNGGSDLSGLIIRNVEILYTNTAAILTATASQFESFDTIARIERSPADAVSLRLASGGAVDLTDELAGRSVTFIGSGSDDKITTSNGADGVDGGDGNDTIDGGAGLDVLKGEAGNDVLTGGLGQDTLDGGVGVDVADYSDKTSSVVVTLNGATNATVIVGGVAEDTIRNIENVRGGAGNDILVGDGLANALFGGAGDDRLKGGEGKDLLDGGAGVDIADYSDQTSSVVVTLIGSANAAVLVGGVAEDTIRNIENVLGGAGNDVLIGDGQANALFGGAGADILKGGLGKDVLDGGAGIDLTDYRDKTSSVIVTLNGSTNAVVTVGGVDEDVIRNIENVLGGSGADILTGDGLTNVLRGGLGKDKLDGGAGVDYADYRDKSSSVVVRLNGSTDVTVTVGGVAEDTIRNFENVIGGSGADRLTGDGNANVLSGEAGNDVLKGGGGMDVLDGGAGVDTADYSDRTASMVVTLNGASNASVTGGNAAENLLRNIENVIGGSGADTLRGDGSANLLAGGGGNDFLQGGGGADVLDGGAGLDLADYSDKTASVVVTLNGAANATVTVGGVAEDTIRNIEFLIGGSGADRLTGDGLANFLRGGGGADVLDGGAGADTASYADRTASVVVTLNGSTNAIVTVGGVVEDTIRNIENLSGGFGADTLTGDALANVLSGGAGADILNGGGGNDSLSGGAGADSFAFKPAFGQDTISDFASIDKLRVDHTIFSDWTSLLGAARQVGSDTLITASATDTILLKNFAVANLAQSQVEFI